MSGGVRAICPVTGTQNSRARVWVRTRPTANFAHNMINLLPDGKTVNIHCSRDPKKGIVNNQLVDWSFKLDGIMHNASQEAVFNTTAVDVVTAALDGYNGTVMCYGQTGAGKTFTITGSTESYQNRGVIPRAISQLFKELNERSDCATVVRISYMEIYNETMFDLLSTLSSSMKSSHQSTSYASNSLQVIEDDQGSVYVRGLSRHLAQNEEDALNMLFEGETNRAIAAHTLNKQSSRSHCVFTIYIESRSRVESNAKYVQSKLNFVDLAGSERLSKTQSEGKTKEEAMYINKSLCFLEQVVLALADRRRDHVPFRQSKLTACLKDSIGGNCNTRLIANVWAEAAHIEETISTLRFATRMMCVAVEPAVNVHFDPAVMVKNLEKELSLLKRELAMHDTLANRSQVSHEPLSEQQRYEIRQQVRAYLDGVSDDIDVINLRQIQAVFEAFRDISGQMSKEIEDRLRARYTLIDKTDPAAILAAQQAGLPINDDGEMVGETDTKGFSVGPTSTSQPAASSVVAARKKDARKAKTRDRTSPTPKTGSPSQASKTHMTEAQPTAAPSASDKDDKREDVMSPTTASRTKEQTPPRPSTPPTRTEAFEDFKKDAGSEIHRILSENKDILAAKKKAYSELARTINCTKDDLDQSLTRLSRLRELRESEGTTYNDDGEVIISEEEFTVITKVKDLKTVYREHFDELRSVKAEVQYCQRLVDQCRQRLIQEFDSWYEESFLGGVTADRPAAQAGSAANVAAGKPETLSKADTCAEDDQERFDRMQKALLMANPESVAFYNAQMRTQRRKIYTAAETQGALEGRRKPGAATRVVRSQPPTMLQVQH